MRIRRFTPTAIEKLKPDPDGRRVDVFGPDNLALRVHPSGVRVWFTMYRVPGTGRQRRMVLGHWPGVTLKIAKERCQKAAKLVQRGKDPAAIREERRRRRKAARTVSELVKDYLRLAVHGRLRTAAEVERILRREVIPAWGDWPIHNVRRVDVNNLLDRVATGHGRTLKDPKTGKIRPAKPAPVAANRLRAYLGAMFAWAIRRDDSIRVNPVSGTDKRADERPRHRVLSDPELQAFLHGLSSVTTKTMSETVRLALWMLVLTGQRAGEVAGARWDEIDEDRATWRIGADRTKNKRAHLVPLSAPALAILEETKPLRGSSAWVFPAVSGRRKGDLPLAPSALNQAIERHLETWKIEKLRAHDIRRTVASHVEALGYRATVPLILNHTPQSVTGRVYIVSDFEDEKRRALDAWSEKVERLRKAKKRGAA